MSNLNEETNTVNKIQQVYRTPPPPPVQPSSTKLTSSAPVTSTSAVGDSSPPPPQAPVRFRSSVKKSTDSPSTPSPTNNEQLSNRPLPAVPLPRTTLVQNTISPNSINYESATNAVAKLVYKSAMTGSVQSLNNNTSSSLKNINSSSSDVTNNEQNENTDQISSSSTNQSNSKHLNDIAGDINNQNQDDNNVISNLIANTINKIDSPQSFSYSSSSYSSKSKNNAPNANSSNNKINKNSSIYPWIFLNGEYIVNKDENEPSYSEIIFVMSDDRGIKGKLYITNFRLYFRSDEPQHTNQINLIINLPLGLIHRIEKIGHQSASRSNFYGLLISCKNGRRLRFATTQEKVSRRQIFDILQKYSFPLSHNMNLFAFSYKQHFHDDSGWQLYDVKSEYERMGILKSNDWRFTFINQQYKFCETYPKILVVPQSVSDDDLKQIGEFRSKKRIPVVSWLKYDNRKNNVALLRSSQPLIGLTQRRSEKDENYLLKVCKLNTINTQDKLYIMDARPQVNAIANRANGGGYENEDNYNYCEILFLNIHNIHVMRESLRKVFDMALPSTSQTSNHSQPNNYLTTGFQSATLSLNPNSNHNRSVSFGGPNNNNSSTTGQMMNMNANSNLNTNNNNNNNNNNAINLNDDKNFFLNLESSRWLEYIRSILNGALKVVKYINDYRSSVLVHCSDGWDRTAQLTSLSMLMMDKYYRTIKGFEVLIEKEWISFGHRFGTRMGHGSDKHSDQDRSPIFLQFIDCVWQILQQNGKVFEFNEKFLLTILNNMYNCQFGTFLYNNEYEREKHDVRNKTVSLWSYINSNKNEFKNNSYVEYDGVVELSTSYSALQLWTAYYFQYKEVIDDSLNEFTLNSISSKYYQQPQNQSQTISSSYTITPPMPSKLFGQAFFQQVVNQMKRASVRNITPQEPELIRYKASIQQSDICSS